MVHFLQSTTKRVKWLKMGQIGSNSMYIQDLDHQRKRILVGESDEFVERGVRKSRFRVGCEYVLWLSQGERACMRRLGRSEEFVVRVEEIRSAGEKCWVVKVGFVSEPLDVSVDMLSGWWWER